MRARRSHRPTRFRPTRWLLVALVLVGLAASALLLRGSADAAVNAGNFAMLFFGALLTGEAVVFALSFDPTTSWPSLREIDKHIGFRAWIAIGGTGAVLLAVGFLTDSAPVYHMGNYTILVADAVGVVSFLRLFTLAHPAGRHRLLRGVLASEIREVALPAGGGAPIVTRGPMQAYLKELDSSLARGDSASIGNLIGQLVDLPVEPASIAAIAETHFEVLHRTCRATLVNGLDGTIASNAISVTTDSLRGYVARLAGPSGGPLPTATLAHQARYLAWLSNSALQLRSQGSLSPFIAREIIVASLSARADIMRSFDPEPNAPSEVELFSPAQDAVAATAWLRCFTEYHGSYQASAMYSYYQILTGRRFVENYYDGALIAGRLREQLASGGYAPAAWPGRPDVADFDKTFILLSANALALFRDASIDFPAELARSEFSPDRRLLCAFFRTHAGHQCLTGADDALRQLAALVAPGERPSQLWSQSSAVLGSLRISPQLPLLHPRRRMPALLLSLLIRLIPMDPDGSLREAERFMAALPPGALDGLQRLVDRITPATPSLGDGPLARLQFIREVPADVE